MSESKEQVGTITRDPEKHKRPDFKVVVNRDPIKFGADVEALLCDGFESTRTVLVVDGCMYGEYVKYPEYEGDGFSIHQVRGYPDECQQKRNEALIKEIPALWANPEFIDLIKRVALDLKHIYETGDVAPAPPIPASSAEADPQSAIER